MINEGNSVCLLVVSLLVFLKEGLLIKVL